MTESAERIQLDDLDSDQKQLAELIGFDNYKLLIETYGGISIYIPKIDSFALTARNEQIRNEFDGYNFRELAKKYELSEVWVRSILSDKTKEMKSKPCDGQISLFG